MAELARQLLYSVYQDNVYSRGINIYTTVQSKDQEAAYRAVRDGVLEYTRRAPYPGPEEQLDLPPAPRTDPQALGRRPGRRVGQISPTAATCWPALVLSANPTEMKVARSSREIITITGQKGPGAWSPAP